MIKLKKNHKKMIDLLILGHGAERLVKHIYPEKGANTLQAPGFQDN